MRRIQCDERSERSTEPDGNGCVAAPVELVADGPRAAPGVVEAAGAGGGAGADTDGIGVVSAGPGSKSPILWTSGAGLCVIRPLILGP